MISALGDIRDAVTALKSGASDYLLKPFDPTELVHKIRNLVSSRKREDLIEAGARTSGVGARLVGESASLRALKVMLYTLYALLTIHKVMEDRARSSR